MATDVTVTDHGYLITAHCRPYGRATLRPVQVAYAVPDYLGWAVMRRVGSRIRTVARIDGHTAAGARVLVTRLLEVTASRAIARQPTT